MFESPHSLWQHFAVAIVAVLVIMSLSSVNANNENDQWMLIKFDFNSKKLSRYILIFGGREFQVTRIMRESHACGSHASIARVQDNCENTGSFYLIDGLSFTYNLHESKRVLCWVKNTFVKMQHSTQAPGLHAPCPLLCQGLSVERVKNNNNIKQLLKQKNNNFISNYAMH